MAVNIDPFPWEDSSRNLPGRPRKFNYTEFKEAYALYVARGEDGRHLYTVPEILSRFSVRPPTFYTRLREYEIWLQTTHPEGTARRQ